MALSEPVPPGGRRAHEVVLRPMREQDLEEVLAIEERVYPRPWSAALFASELGAGRAHAPRRYLVARSAISDAMSEAPAESAAEGRLLGYAGVLVLVDEAHVTTVAVDPAEHRRKVATRLLVAVLEAGRELGAAAATLEVRAANRGAQRLYAQLGFAPVGVRPGYYDDTGEDALIMWLHELGSAAVARRLRAQAARCRAPGGASGAPDLHVPWVHGRVGLTAGSGEGVSAPCW